MEVPNVEQLLDYVFTDEDYSDDPSTKEYKKLCRVMKVMVNFYKRGERNKLIQHEETLEQLAAVTGDLEMARAQLASLKPFPTFHHKRGYFETELENEIKELTRHRDRYQEQADSYNRLHEWGVGIVSTVEWLEGNLKHYANQKLGMSFDIEPLRLTTEEYKKFKRGLEEITYNLQESQDFFEASLDGRLKSFHQLEKCMIEAQLEVLAAYPEDSLRRQHVEAELRKDLAFCESNMVENPQVMRHRERMQRMHKDFFAILKWQRKRMLQILDNEPEKIVGDAVQLKAELEAQKSQAEEKVFASKFGEGGGAESCPVPHVRAAAIAAKKSAEVQVKKDEGLIHKVFDA